MTRMSLLKHSSPESPGKKKYILANIQISALREHEQRAETHYDQASDL